MACRFTSPVWLKKKSNRTSGAAPRKFKSSVSTGLMFHGATVSEIFQFRTVCHTVSGSGASVSHRKNAFRWLRDECIELKLELCDCGQNCVNVRIIKIANVTKFHDASGSYRVAAATVAKLHSTEMNFRFILTNHSAKHHQTCYRIWLNSLWFSLTNSRHPIGTNETTAKRINEQQQQKLFIKTSISGASTIFPLLFTPVHSFPLSPNPFHSFEPPLPSSRRFYLIRTIFHFICVEILFPSAADTISRTSQHTVFNGIFPLALGAPYSWIVCEERSPALRRNDEYDKFICLAKWCLNHSSHIIMTLQFWWIRANWNASK